MSVISKDERISILKDLISIKSVNDNELEVANYLHDLFEKHGITSKVLPISDNRANFVAEIGSGSPVVAVTGHMDVVDPGKPEQWDTDPFEMTEKDGKFYGRGTDDMKGGLAALAIAMIELNNDGKPANGTIRLLATIGEEVGEEGSYTFYKDGYMKDAEALLVAEPSGYQIAHAQKGSMDLKLTAEGIAVHSSLPEIGYNAIDSLISILHDANETFRDENNPKSDLLGPMTFNADVIEGGSQVNSIPDHAEVQINVRTVPAYDNDMVLKKLNEIIDDFNKNHATKDIQTPVSLEVLMNEPSVEEPNDTELIKLSKKIGEQYSEDEIPVFAAAGITDASNLVRDKGQDFPFMIFGPGDPAIAHKINEYVEKDMYLNFIDIYYQIFESYGK